MEIHLTEHEARVLGCLLEKEVTTPDYYPLSLNAVVAACNQKSNRDPVMSLGEREVLEALDGLTSKHLASEKTPSGSRVTKYSNRLSNSLGLTYDFSAEERAVLCVLMLRGPQTVGEVRSRIGRLARFESLEHVEQVVTRLETRADGPYVVRLARQPGRKEPRYAHLLCGPVAEEASPAPVRDHAASPGAEERLEILEREVADLRAEVERLKHALGE